MYSRIVGTAARRGSNTSRRVLIAGVFASLCLPVLACGPDFPHELLSDRHASVYGLVEGTFDFEASQLAPKPGNPFKPNENPWEAPGESRIELEQRELGKAAYANVEAMRLGADDQQAWAAGEGLSEEVRLYTAGARAFHAGDTAIALQRFDAVLALPAEQQRSRGLWARYMRGRVNLVQAAGGAGVGEAEIAAAMTAAAQDFQAVRAVVAAGATDPLGLAVASFGEEAALQRARGNTAAAVRLYAEQAAHGSASGRASLLFTARDLFADDAALRAALADPLLQQLLASYVYTRTGEFEGTDEAGQPKPQAAALQRYYAAIEADTAGTIGGVDRVAAAAYRSARYELAGTLAARSQTALAHWVRAKLALRAGDDKTAADAYAQASRAFPRDQDWGTNPNEGYSNEGLKPACRVDGERAILALGRGDYVEALRLFHAGGGQYWMDEAQVAERVLSVDELKRYVDTNVPEPAAPPKANDEGWTPPQPDAQLRALLGRRLLRSGRYAEAAPYFPPALRETAAAYAKARMEAPKQGRIERAETLFRAARLARESGMELLALELAPDAALFEGSYELTDPTLDTQDRKLVGADEAQRVTASQPQLKQRFHYRFVAADLANQAADLVPARSQAFAAMLCSATGWLINRDHTQARRYYRRYIDQGPYVAWAANFGSQCPAPDFAGAAKRLQFERVRWAKQIVRRYAPFVAGGALVVVVGFVFWRRRRTKTAR